MNTDHTNRRSYWITAALLVSATSMAIGLGCGSARRSEPLVGPMPLDDPQLAAGQQVFMRECYQCHPGGQAGQGPALNNKPAPAFLIKTQVRKGLGKMPAFDEKAISDEQLDALAKYVIALREHKGRS